MGSTYSRYISDRDPIDDCYDWPITGIPGEQLCETGLDTTPNCDYAGERWKESELPNIWISDYGRVYNLKTGNFISPSRGDNHGHLAIKSGGKQKYYHRMLATAFIDNNYDDPYVRHLDDNPSNNELENLAWGTQHENHLDCVRNGTYRGITDDDRRKSIETTRHGVIATNLSTGEELYFESQGDAGRKLNIPQANIWKVIVGERKTAGGFTFRELSREEEKAYI